MLDRGQSRGRTRHEQNGNAIVNLFFFELLADFGGDIDDVAEPGGLFGYFFSANRQHSKALKHRHTRSDLATRAALSLQLVEERFQTLDSFSLANQFFGPFERSVDLTGFLAACLGEVGPAAAAAANHAGKLFDDISRVVLSRQLLAN